jgi:fructose-1,6-bisphosphatase/inositol monophosphatase family enzyme
MLISLNSSLSSAYVAAGKLDGIVNAHNYSWDICAASFLVQQSGRTITDLKGQPWSVFSDGAIAAEDQETHQKLLDCYIED